MKKPVYKLALLLCSFVPAGCAEQSGPVVLDTEGVAPRVDYSHLDAVLSEVLRKDGLLDAKAMTRMADQLDAQLLLLAATGPTVTPELLADADAALAYWCNARAAWAMKLAMLAEFPEQLPARMLAGRAFTLDGRQMTLEDIDAEILARGGWQAVVAAPGICFGRAELPRNAFEDKDVRQRVERRFGEFLDDRQRFIIDVARKQVHIPAVLWRFSQGLIDEHNRSYGTTEATLTTALLARSTGSAQRRLQDAIGYVCVGRRYCGKLAVFKEK